ncbi:MAG: DEAD/DEAH box helicase [Culicoidibacterales bacterium]
MAMQTKYADYNFKKDVKKAIDKLGFVTPTPIQHEVFPAALKGENVIGQAPTGTGKTHAFLIPIFEKLDVTRDEVQAVIIAPTRELAEQITLRARELARFSHQDVRILLAIGGTDRDRLVNKLKNQEGQENLQPQLVIGTPGRIQDIVVKEKVLKIYTAKTMVVDEVDMIFDTGFLEAVDELASICVNAQLLVFSATIPAQLSDFIQKYLSGAKSFRITPKQATPIKIEHVLVPVRRKERSAILLDVIANINPYLAMVFANTRKSASEVATFLREQGYKVGELHGDLNPRERRQMLRRVRNLEFQYVVASDIAARGIDIDGVSHVINYEVPKDLDFYIHRSGRTARVDNQGIVYTLVEPAEEPLVQKLRDRGVEFTYQEVNSVGEWKVISRQRRESRGLTAKNEKETKIQNLAAPKVKGKKVKPGYKAKRKRLADEALKKSRRQEARQAGRQDRKAKAKAHQGLY